MKIEFENLGPIEQGSVELNDFTIFCGQNNSGKTYVMCSLYALLNNRFKINFDFVKPIVERLKQEESIELDIEELVKQHQTEMLNHIEQRFKEYLPNLFGAAKSEFTNTEIKISFSDREIKERLEIICTFTRSWEDEELNNFNRISVDTVSRYQNDTYQKKVKISLNNIEIQQDNFLETYISEKLVHIILFDWWSSRSRDMLLPAERSGLEIFYKELFSVRNLLLQTAQNDNVNPMSLLKDVLQARYAQPIKDYLQFLNQIGTTKNDTSDYIQYAEIVEKEIVKGKYTVDDNGNIFFTPYETKTTLPLHFCSSTVKSLFALAFYLEHLARKGDYLMIDEPELNLHPDNQRQVARILAQLVNAGLKVIVSTHSDYFVRELNNLIMLKKGFTGAKELQEKYGYQDNELLDGEKQVSAYLFDDKKITEMKLDEDEGIIAKTFDEVINKLNQSSNEIYYTMQDAKEQVS